MTFTPPEAPVGGSALLSALVALIPLVVFFSLIGVMKMASHRAALLSLAVGMVIAVGPFNMPAALAAMSALQGVAFAFFPIISIIIAAVWLYAISEQSGRNGDLEAIFAHVGRGDRRTQAFLIALGFCGLLEGLAGFGSPIVIVGAMLVSIGIPPLKAALAAIVGNIISFGFGAMGIPTLTGAKMANLPPHGLAATMGMISPYAALFIPAFIIAILDGKRGLKQLWPAIIVAGVATGATHALVSRYFSYELVAVIASLVDFIVLSALLRVWQPVTPEEWKSPAPHSLTLSRSVLALMPYWLVIIVFGVGKLWRLGIDIPALLEKTDIVFPWPYLHGRLMAADGAPSTATLFTFHTVAAPATLIALTAVIVVASYARWWSDGQFPFTVGQGLRALIDTVRERLHLFATISTVMALAYVMNFSGQTSSIGLFFAQAGAGFAVLSPVLGWIGTAATGSSTSSNALFANLQATAATHLHASPDLFVAANTVSGEIGKAVSPQNLAIAAASVGQKNCESTIVRKVFPWSLALLVVLCCLIPMARAGWLPGF